MEIETLQDENGCDLDPDYRVESIFSYESSGNILQVMLRNDLNEDLNKFQKRKRSMPSTPRENKKRRHLLYEQNQESPLGSDNDEGENSIPNMNWGSISSYRNITHDPEELRKVSLSSSLQTDYTGTFTRSIIGNEPIIEHNIQSINEIPSTNEEMAEPKVLKNVQILGLNQKALSTQAIPTSETQIQTIDIQSPVEKIEAVKQTSNNETTIVFTKETAVQTTDIEFKEPLKMVEESIQRSDNETPIVFTKEAAVQTTDIEFKEHLKIAEEGIQTIDNKEPMVKTVIQTTDTEIEIPAETTDVVIEISDNKKPITSTIETVTQMSNSEEPTAPTIETTIETTNTKVKEPVRQTLDNKIHIVPTIKTDVQAINIGIEPPVEFQKEQIFDKTKTAQTVIRTSENNISEIQANSSTEDNIPIANFQNENEIRKLDGELQTKDLNIGSQETQVAAKTDALVDYCFDLTKMAYTKFVNEKEEKSIPLLNEPVTAPQRNENSNDTNNNESPINTSVIPAQQEESMSDTTFKSKGTKMIISKTNPPSNGSSFLSINKQSQQNNPLSPLLPPILTIKSRFGDDIFPNYSDTSSISRGTRYSKRTRHSRSPITTKNDSLKISINDVQSVDKDNLKMKSTDTEKVDVPKISQDHQQDTVQSVEKHNSEMKSTVVEKVNVPKVINQKDVEKFAESPRKKAEYKYQQFKKSVVSRKKEKEKNMIEEKVVSNTQDKIKVQKVEESRGTIDSKSNPHKIGSISSTNSTSESNDKFKVIASEIKKQLPVKYPRKSITYDIEHKKIGSNGVETLVEGRNGQESDKNNIEKETEENQLCLKKDNTDTRMNDNTNHNESNKRLLDTSIGAPLSNSIKDEIKPVKKKRKRLSKSNFLKSLQIDMLDKVIKPIDGNSRLRRSLSNPIYDEDVLESLFVDDSENDADNKRESPNAKTNEKRKRKRKRKQDLNGEAIEEKEQEQDLNVIKEKQNKEQDLNVKTIEKKEEQEQELNAEINEKQKQEQEQEDLNAKTITKKEEREQEQEQAIEKQEQAQEDIVGSSSGSIKNKSIAISETEVEGDLDGDGRDKVEETEISKDESRLYHEDLLQDHEEKHGTRDSNTDYESESHRSESPISEYKSTKEAIDEAIGSHLDEQADDGSSDEKGQVEDSSDGKEELEKSPTCESDNVLNAAETSPNNINIINPHTPSEAGESGETGGAQDDDSDGKEPDGQAELSVGFRSLLRGATTILFG